MPSSAKQKPARSAKPPAARPASRRTRGKQKLVPETSPSADASPGMGDTGLAGFVGTVAEKWRQREHLLSVVRQFYESPQQFGLHPEAIPHGSSVEEVKEAAEYLEYRISLLRALLGAMEEELQLLRAAGAKPAPARKRKKIN